MEKLAMEIGSFPSVKMRTFAGMSIEGVLDHCNASTKIQATVVVSEPHNKIYVAVEGDEDTLKKIKGHLNLLGDIMNGKKAG